MNALRFYCPKCDSKYRIDEDKLAQRPNAQMRCKACHTVIGVQTAVRLANERQADGRAAMNSQENLSLPPPKPSALALKSSVPPVATPAAKGVVTMPLLDVTAKSKPQAAQQLSAKPAITTKIGLTKASLPAGPKSGPRGPGAAALLVSKGLRGSGERPSPAHVKAATERAVDARAKLPQALGRGSAVGFPAVTEERTQPVVPPLPRMAREEIVDASRPAAAQQAASEADESFNDLDAELALIESEAPPASAIAEEPDSQIDASEFTVREAESAWLDTTDPPFAAQPSARPVTFSAQANSVVPAPATSPMQSVEFSESGDKAHSHVALRSSLAASSQSSELDWATPEAKRKISLSGAIASALIVGLVSFGAGYLCGQRANAAGIDRTPVTVNQPHVLRQDLPPPPPPPAQAANENESQSTSGSEARTAMHYGAASSLVPAGRQSAQSATNGEPLSGGASDLNGLVGPLSGPTLVQANKLNTAEPPGLTAQAIQATVQKNQPSIRRSCWQAAIQRRGSEAGSSARVMVTVTIAATGRVSGVSHEGDPVGYQGLAGCVASRVRVWKFPRAPAATTVNVPFVFAAQ